MKGFPPAERDVNKLVGAVFLTALGRSLFLTISAIYFTTEVGLSTVEVGVGLSTGGLCGLLGGIPTGVLADRYGAQRVELTALCIAAAATAVYLEVRSFAAFVPVAALALAADRASSAARGGLLASLVAGPRRIRVRGHLLVATNVGFGLGGSAGALVLSLNQPKYYQASIVLNALAWALAACVISTIPHTRHSHSAASGYILRAAQDTPFLGLAALTGLMAMQIPILDVGLPLWITGHTEAPRTVAAFLMILNAVLVAVSQGPVGRRIHSPAKGIRAIALSGTLLLAACTVYALAAHVDREAAIAALALGSLVQVAAEVIFWGGQYLLSFELAREDAQGTYQALTSTGLAAGLMLGPVVISLLPLRLGAIGWLLLGCTFPLCGFCTRFPSQALLRQGRGSPHASAPPTEGQLLVGASATASPACLSCAPSRGSTSPSGTHPDPFSPNGPMALAAPPARSRSRHDRRAQGDERTTQ